MVKGSGMKIDGRRNKAACEFPDDVWLEIQARRREAPRRSIPAVIREDLGRYYRLLDGIRQSLAELPGDRVERIRSDAARGLFVCGDNEAWTQQLAALAAYVEAADFATIQPTEE